MQFDREDTLKRAEKFLRQGRLDLAIADYERVLEDQPRDWATANILGDLYVRAGEPDRAAAQYSRVGAHFMHAGFYSKSAAIYKKILKLRPDDEAAQLQLAEVSQKQGLLADARAYLGAVAARRRARGDQAGATEIVIRIGELDPADFEARLAAARALAAAGDTATAAARLRSISDGLMEKGRSAEALEALGEAVRLDPTDREGRIALAQAAMASGDGGAARRWLDGLDIGADPGVWLALVEMELDSARLQAARDVAVRLLESGASPEPVLALAWRTAESRPDAAYVLVDAAVAVASAAGQHAEATARLQEFVSKVPGHLDALQRLVEICVQGGLESGMSEAQALLAEAYLAAGRASEARAAAEDLVAREPWEQGHIDRFRRILEVLDHPEPDAIIAERLGGQSPFTSVDRFTPAGEAVPPDAAEPAGAVEEPPAGADPATVAEVSRAPAGASGNLDQVFSDLRDQVARQSGTDPVAQQMALADTYLEVGMEAEAVKALEAAAASPRFCCDAAARLGRLYQQRGDPKSAAAWLERAADAQAPSLEVKHAVLYDLGVVVESCGETARALAILLELQAEAGAYRDTAERIERLARVETGG